MPGQTVTKPRSVFATQGRKRSRRGRYPPGLVVRLILVGLALIGVIAIALLALGLLHAHVVTTHFRIH
jgi:hypothetical protein